MVLIAPGGALVGVMSTEGRALSKPKGAGFVARVWLENDGDAGDQFTAHTRWDRGQGTRNAVPLRWEGGRVWHLAGKRAWAAFPGCAPDDVVISAVEMPFQPGCSWYDPAKLRETGAVALRWSGAGVTVSTAREHAGQRLWNGSHEKKTGPRRATPKQVIRKTAKRQ